MYEDISQTRLRERTWEMALGWLRSEFQNFSYIVLLPLPRCLVVRMRRPCYTVLRRDQASQS
jgi:hypothetical protein